MADTQTIIKPKLSAQEEQLILNAFNDTKRSYPSELTAMDLFEKQVALTPDRTAIIDHERAVSYAEFNRMANCLAHTLRKMGVGVEDRVAIIARRSTELLVAIYATMKADAAYVPIDMTYPQERIDYILQDCAPKAVIVFGANITTDYPVIDLSDPSVYSGQTENFDRSSCPQSLAYVIYTSGTTGKPKGVMLDHRALVNHICITDHLYYPKKDVVTPLFTNHCFDFAVPMIFVPLMNGGTVMLFDEKDDAIIDVLQNDEVSVVKVTPSVLRAALDAVEYRKERKLDTIILGGEALTGDLVASVKRNIGSHIKCYNEYGPTEAAVFCAIYLASGDEEHAVPIGKPVANTQLYILDGLELCGIGVVGELCIAGDCLARGYLNRPELTREKFIPNPFGSGMLYRTGDLAKWLPDGNIEFLGRIDEQVKIRGFRVELDEIESVLRSFESVKDCAVIVREEAHGEKAICAFLVGEAKLDISSLRNELMQKLPGYMIPSYWMQIDFIPVTRNGKLDKKALPQIEHGEEYAPPQTPMQKSLCEIFAQVLGQERIGIHDDFFAFGGHSLRVIKLMNRLEKLCGRRPSQREIFDHPTPMLLAQLIESASMAQASQIPLAPMQEIYPMSSAQKRMYLVSQMGDHTAYNLPTAWRIEGHLDPERLKAAFEKMIARHESLRTEFFLQGDEPVQRILKEVEPNFVYRCDALTEETTLLTQFLRTFDLSKAPQMRIELIERGDYQLLLMDAHHIISDGMSAEIFRKELSAYYRGESLAPLQRQYKDYSHWMHTRDLSAQANYWLERFSDGIPQGELPWDFNRPQRQSHCGSTVSIELDAAICDAVRAMAKKNAATEYMVFLSAAMVLLAKYSRQEDVVIGSAFSGRTHADTEAMLGMFVNTIAMRSQPKAELSCEEFLQQIKQICLQAYENQEYPFDRLVESLNIRREAARNPLFDVMLVVQNNDHEEFDFGDVGVSKIPAADTGATFDLTFNIEQNKNAFTVVLEYSTDLFRASSAQRILKQYVSVLSQMMVPESKLRHIHPATDAEIEQILYRFNQTQAPYDEKLTIAQLFERQVEQTPEHIAVICENERITYAELNCRANQIAHRLRSYGIGKNDLVAVLTKRSIDMIAAIYGVLKSGGAYVPIDPSYPLDRRSYILQDSRAKAVICNVDVSTELPVIDLRNDVLDIESSANPIVINGANDLAYCIYTSGTTGQPKGVLLEQHGVANLKSYFKDRFGITTEDRVLQFANYVFDGSVWEMNMALLNGARLIVATNQLDIPAFEQMCEREGVTVASLPPNFYAQLQNIHPRILVTAGSAADLGTVEKAKGCRYINSYGPTEGTVAATHWEPEGEFVRVPIGRPIQNVQAYILQNTELCGIGVIGELCIGGAGLARGYLNQPELTEEKFVPNPFGDGKLYRTGDLARWLEDGNIEFLGRVDEQVKIRGFRVELGEIDYALRKIDGVSDCAVIVRDDSAGEAAIYAYVVCENADFDHIRALLKKSLPDYMIPTYMMQLESIPVTRNGKLDKRALPEIELRSDSEYIPPRNRAEMLLCEAFSQILNISCVSVKDSFFEFGGDSIKAIRVVSKLRENGCVLTVKDIMENATVEEIAMYAQLKQAEIYDQSPVTGVVVDTPMIEQFKRWDMRKPEHFNQAVMLPIHCSEEIVRNALAVLLEHHDMLRAVWKDGHLVIGEEANLELQSYDFRAEPDPISSVMEQADAIQRSFDLANGPLLKAAIFQTDYECALMICIHHLVVDAISWQILLEDLNRVIDQQMKGEPICVAAKTASFLQWAQALEEYRTSDELQSELAYWKDITAMLPDAVLQMRRTPTEQIATVTTSLTAEQTDLLLHEAGRAYNTQINDLLLAALSMAVSQLTRQRQIAVCMEGHGREEIHRKIDIDRTVGWFTCAYPVILECYDDTENAVISAKEMLRKVPNHGLGYSLLPDLDRSIPIDVYFNYLGESSAESHLPYGECIAAENRFAGEINFNGEIRNGLLVFKVSCNLTTFDEEAAKLIAECYREKLVQIIEFCCGSEESHKTMADMDADDLDEADFDEINAILGLF